MTGAERNRPTVASSAGDETTSTTGLIVGVTLGVPIVLFGAAGAIADRELTRPVELAKFVLGAAVVHDLALAPAVIALGWCLRRATPPRVARALRTIAVIAGPVALMGFPFVRGYGRNPANPSLLPRDYGTGLLVGLVALAGFVVGLELIAALRRRRGHSAGS